MAILMGEYCPVHGNYHCVCQQQMQQGDLYNHYLAMQQQGIGLGTMTGGIVGRIESEPEPNNLLLLLE